MSISDRPIGEVRISEALRGGSDGQCRDKDDEEVKEVDHVEDRHLELSGSSNSWDWVVL